MAEEINRHLNWDVTCCGWHILHVRLLPFFTPNSRLATTLLLYLNETLLFFEKNDSPFLYYASRSRQKCHSQVILSQSLGTQKRLNAGIQLKERWVGAAFVRNIVWLQCVFVCFGLLISCLGTVQSLTNYCIWQQEGSTKP